MRLGNSTRLTYSRAWASDHVFQRAFERTVVQLCIKMIDVEGYRLCVRKSPEAAMLA